MVSSENPSSVEYGKKDFFLFLPFTESYRVDVENFVNRRRYSKIFVDILRIFDHIFVKFAYLC